MGAWGHNSFENDTAGDWIWDLKPYDIPSPTTMPRPRVAAFSWHSSPCFGRHLAPRKRTDSNITCAVRFTQQAW